MDQWNSESESIKGMDFYKSWDTVDTLAQGFGRRRTHLQEDYIAAIGDEANRVVGIQNLPKVRTFDFFTVFDNRWGKGKPDGVVPTEDGWLLNPLFSDSEVVERGEVICSGSEGGSGGVSSGIGGLPLMMSNMLFSTCSEIFERARLEQ